LPPLNLYARVRFFVHPLHTRPRVQRAPGIPCALWFLWADCSSTARAHRAARWRTCIWMSSIPLTRNNSQQLLRGGTGAGVFDCRL